jgi:hypothetical protein
MKRFVFVFLFIAAVVACSSTDSEPFPSDDIAELDGNGFDQTLGFDAPFDTGTKYNGGGPFVCGDCPCDGTIDFCFFNGGGGGAPVVDANIDDASDDATDATDDASDDDASDADDAGCGPNANVCTAIPIGCLPKPTCECIEAFFPDCPCTVDETGNGFQITCPPKP